MINETVWYPDGQSEFDYDSLRELTSRDFTDIFKFLVIKSTRDLFCIKVIDSLLTVRVYLLQDETIGIFTWYKDKKVDDIVWMNLRDLEWIDKMYRVKNSSNPL